MLSDSIQKYLNHLLAGKLQKTIASIQFKGIGGGSINDTYQVKINNTPKFFLKLNSITKFPGLFEKEKNGLEFLGRQDCIRVPSIVSCDIKDDHQILLLEWIEHGPRTERFWKKFGEQLAQLHKISNKNFGFAEDNYMGSLPQVNTWTDSWIDFFITRRLQPQIELAHKKNLLEKRHFDSFETVNKKLSSIFNNEKPSLLHGDLWSGNFMCNDQSLPVLIDPAVYFGYRNIDLAMTTLFEGFDKDFYDAYHYHFPFPSNYHEQWEVCNLYPLLIHLNLFGRSYLHQIERTLQIFS